MVIHACNPNYMESLSRRMAVQAILGKKKRPHSESNKAQRLRVYVAQVVECLHSKHKALSLNSSTAEEEKGGGGGKGRERREEGGGGEEEKED
jgi:hypothetical protein